jgi:RNA polymerase sigma-70 factor, ECF subfamily
MESSSKVKEKTDNELIIILNSGQNPEVYQEIVYRYQRKLFTYLYRLVGNREESEDLLQNVFVKVYKNSRQFDVERKFSSWIYRIAHNEGVNFLKRRDKKRFISWDDIVTSKDKLETQSDEVSPLGAWIDKEIQEEVQCALNKLPDKYKQVLTLRYFSDKSYDEISRILDKPVNTVGTLLNRAKKKLEKVMEE